MKRKAIRLAVEIAVCLIVVLAFIVLNIQIVEDKKISFIATLDSGEFAYCVDEINIEETEMVIKGWFFSLKKVRNEERIIDSNKKLGILLFRIDNQEQNSLKEDLEKTGIPLNVEYTYRNDVNEYFKCEYDYSRCGFIAKINSQDIDILNSEYQIVFKPDEEAQIGIMSNSYIIDGDLSYVSSKDIVKIDTEGTDLKKIVDEGTCVASCPEYNIAIYQKEWDLYWIADEHYNFENDGTTYITYEMATTQFDKLPKERIEHGWYWSNIGANFEDYEITDELQCGKYRVCKRRIPEEYSVVFISTGYYYDDAYVWNRHIRPIYNYYLYKNS